MNDGGIVNRAFYDAGEREFTFLRVQDVEPILEHNAILRQQEQHGESFRQIGSVPNVMIEKWLHEELDRGNVGLRIGSEEFDRLIWRKLQDFWFNTTMRGSAFTMSRCIPIWPRLARQ
mgnify:CR=1 FL=1